MSCVYISAVASLRYALNSVTPAFPPPPIPFPSLPLSGKGPINAALRLLVFGDMEDPLKAAEEGKGGEEADSAATPTQEAVTEQLSTGRYCAMLLFCVVGLQGSYLTWGVLQVCACVCVCARAWRLDASYSVFLTLSRTSRTPCPMWVACIACVGLYIFCSC